MTFTGYIIVDPNDNPILRTLAHTEAEAWLPLQCGPCPSKLISCGFRCHEVQATSEVVE
jgi:hypothetical protein